jgi:hypothetical protein
LLGRVPAEQAAVFQNPRHIRHMHDAENKCLFWIEVRHDQSFPVMASFGNDFFNVSVSLR